MFGLLRFVAQSAVGLAAIRNPVDADNLPVLFKKDAMVAGTKPKEALELS